jgi:hypothetical protein
MAHTQISFGRKIMSGVAVAGGAAALATGMALAGAGTAAADNQYNVLNGDGNRFAPSAGVSAAAADPGTNFLTNLGTAISNGQRQLGVAGTNALIQTGTAGSNAQFYGGTAGTNAISQTGTAIQNGQVQVGTAGTNALTQLGQAGNGFLSGIGNLFNRG